MPQESKLQAKIRRWLTNHGWLVVKINLCSRAGWPDLFCIRDSRSAWIEVKDHTKPRPLQLFRQQEIRKYGGESHIVTSWEEFKALGLD